MILKSMTLEARYGETRFYYNPLMVCRLRIKGERDWGAEGEWPDLPWLYWLVLEFPGERSCLGRIWHTEEEALAHMDQVAEEIDQAIKEVGRC